MAEVLPSPAAATMLPGAAAGAGRRAASGPGGWSGLILLALPLGTLAQVVSASGFHALDVGDLLCVAACAVLARQAALAGEGLPARARTVLLGASLLWFAVDPRLGTLALTLSGLAVLASRPQAATARSAWLWLALSGHGLWGPVALKLASPVLMPVETHVVGLAARLLGAAASVQGTRVDGPGGWYIYVLEGCSSLHGLSLDLVVWASALALADARVTRRALTLLAAAAAGTVVANTLRILVMARSAGDYHTWHVGSGATLFGLALSLIAVVPAVLACGRGRGQGQWRGQAGRSASRPTRSPAPSGAHLRMLGQGRATGAALTALLLAFAMVGGVAARSGAAKRGSEAWAVPPALARNIAVRPSARSAGGVVAGTLAVAGCPGGVGIVVMPAFYSSVDPDSGLAGGDGTRFLTFYAGVRLPEGVHRVASTALHLLREAGEALRVSAPSFATETVVRFAVPRGCPPETEAELGRVMAAAAAR